MIRARLRPLLALVLLLASVLLARLFQVQVLEHEVWALEAARLVLHGREQPYRRGRILDAAEHVLARDEEGRSVDLVYREFRRSHPLGQVAHARSLLEGRPVPLSEARAHLVEWGCELAALTPRDLGAFARGEGGERSKRGFDRRLQARRASDLLFYVQRLLGLDGSDQRATRKRVLTLAGAEGGVRSFLALTASVRRGNAAEGIEAERDELAARLARSLERLALLAHWLRPDTADPMAVLVDDVERERRLVEDASAAKLFAEAAGFAPGRIEADTLLECFDHGWIAALLAWDGARLVEWARTVRAGWQTTWRDEVCLPQIFGNLAFDPRAELGEADFLARLAVVYQPEGELARALGEGPRPWREVDELAVFAELGGLFEAELPATARELGDAALPIQLAELRADPDDGRLLPRGEGPGSFAAELARACSGRGRREIEKLLALARALNEIWELRFQETLREALDETRRAAAHDELGADGGLVLAAAGRDRAAERAEYFLMDFGSRSRPLSAGELSYDVVYLLTRHERDFPGFRVRTRETRARVELAGDDLRPAERLLGRVQEPTIDDLLRQRRDRTRLRELEQRPGHEEDELEELQRLIGEVRRATEVRGVEGLEAFFDRELTGKNGFTLTRGLTDVFGAGGDVLPVREPVDGEDVVLTLHADMQAAAQRCLRQPSAEHEDDDWERNPVGAIVLLSRDGDVLAAASEPDDESFVDPEAGAQRQLRIERTLKKPTFQPPGSVIKVFFAAWALEHGLDPNRTAVCGPIEGGGSGYKTLRCWNTGGHGTVDLHAALVQSCNAYFAWLGETLDTTEFAAVCAQFGFGEPTGVRCAPPWDDGGPRRGLSEDRAGLSLPEGGAGLRASLRSMAANGLAVIEATPMQLARGMLALATGEKCELRLVRRIGERELPSGARAPLELRPETLAFVRAAMRGVAEELHGTAHVALSASELGFSVAVKTGSADLENRKDREGKSQVRKHAWVAGWAPAREPELVFVVFEHDTSATSSHGAVFLARQLLRQPEVLLYLAERGVDVSGVPAR